MKKQRRDPKQLIGKYILVGLTYMNPDGSVREIKQLHGRIKSANRNTVTFQRADGEGEFCIPFDPEIEPSDPEAVYKLKSTGEAVEGVDYINTWTIYPPGTELGKGK